ncbi:hypothetical protein CEV32_0323 [Brucella rhizosphaerae]|uniref:Uncharacterized protein n=1 Tax=Brucella rhizosphaerae TaxID=571254 RepID=A0A256FHI1_9HYPH|nr:hypothetical protein CEV32_0323 [Brucella rhizosphaerae]
MILRAYDARVPSFGGKPQSRLQIHLQTRCGRNQPVVISHDPAGKSFPIFKLMPS